MHEMNICAKKSHPRFLGRQVDETVLPENKKFQNCDVFFHASNIDIIAFELQESTNRAFG